MYNPDVRPPQAMPALFGGYGLLFLLAATVLAARLSAPWVALLTGSLCLVGLLARFWARYSLARLTYGRRLSSPRAFCGDTLVLETTLGNRKLLPLPWVEAWERLPLALDPGAAIEASPGTPGYGRPCPGPALWAYQRAGWRQGLQCRRRGVYTLGAVRARSGDPFGLAEREAWLPAQLELVVYPRVVPLRRLGLPLRHPAPDLTSRRSLVTDPTRTAWLRDYQPGDPQRLIHWPATAHQGALQVRVLEQATTLQVSLVLDARSFRSALPLYRDTLFELALSALASIAVYLSEVGCPVGLYTDASPPTALLPSANPGQPQLILEALARVEPHWTAQAERWPLARLPRGSAVVLAASDAAHDLGPTVALLEGAGHPVVLLMAGRSARVPGALVERLVRLVPAQDLAATLEGWA